MQNFKKSKASVLRKVETDGRMGEWLDNDELKGSILLCWAIN